MAARQTVNPRRAKGRGGNQMREGVLMKRGGGLGGWGGGRTTKAEERR